MARFDNNVKADEWFSCMSIMRCYVLILLLSLVRYGAITTQRYRKTVPSGEDNDRIIVQILQNLVGSTRHFLQFQFFSIQNYLYPSKQTGSFRALYNTTENHFILYMHSIVAE